MRKHLPLAAILTAVVFIAGCKSPTEIQVSEIDGDYVVTSALLSGLEDPKNNRVDLLELGFVITFSSDGTGAFTLTLTDPLDVTTVITGVLEIDGTDLFEEGQSVGEVFVEDDQVALSLFGDEFEFDFNGNGQEDPARLLLVMER